MTPTHAVKNGRRYRYYVSHPLITQARAGSPGGLRVPAPEIEQLVANRIRQFLSEPDSILEATAQLGLNPTGQRRLIDRAVQLASGWSMLPSTQVRALFTMLIRRIAVYILIAVIPDDHVLNAEQVAVGLCKSNGGTCDWQFEDSTRVKYLVH